MIFGSKKTRTKVATSESESDGTVLAALGIAAGPRTPGRSFGRRDVPFGFSRLFVPSLVRDYTTLLLRQRGLVGQELFVVWAGMPAGEDAVVTSVVVPRADAGHLHGEIPAHVVGALFESLDSRDLVPFAQLHTHPASSRMSNIDRERPIVAIKGFLSIIVPDFAFTTGDPAKWSVYEYESKLSWRLWQAKEAAGRLVVDDSVIRVGE